MGQFSTGLVALHELGHVLGLGHPVNTTQRHACVGFLLHSLRYCGQETKTEVVTYLGLIIQLLRLTPTQYYRLASSTPSTPSGGTSDEDHLPSGWSRTAPSPTQTLDVYRSQRSVSRTNGVFNSATAWETPTLFDETDPPDPPDPTDPAATSTAWTENYNFDTSAAFGFTSDSDNWSIPASWLVEDSLTTAFFYIINFIVSGQLRLLTVRSGSEGPGTAGPQLKEECVLELF